MKNTWIRLSIIILITINFKLSGQYTVHKECLSQADYLYANEQYKPAIKEYQRYLFMTGNEDVEILLKLAHGLFETKNYDLSLQYYDKIYYLSNNPVIKFQCRLNEITYRLVQKEYRKALVGLFSINSDYYSLYPQIIDFLFAVSYFGLEDFDQSEKYFLNITASDPEISAEIREIFSNKKKFYKPNPNTVSILSLFIPGLGQFLSAEYKEGLNSFILVEGIGVIAVFVALRYSILDAILSIIPWYQRYLTGGSEKAEELAIEKRSRNRNEMYLEILDVLKPYSHLLEFNDGQFRIRSN